SKYVGLQLKASWASYRIWIQAYLLRPDAGPNVPPSEAVPWAGSSAVPGDQRARLPARILRNRRWKTMYRGVRLGRIHDIEVIADWSLLIIFLLVAVSLATGLFPRWHPDWRPAMSWITALTAAVLFFASVLAHELSHALVGRRDGVMVRRITLFVFGGMAHMENEPPSWGAELRMAIAGPLLSIAIGVACLLLVSASVGPVEVRTEDEAV